MLLPFLAGCVHPSITAVNLTNPNEPEGIPYYLPKPYLIVSKNIRYIPTPTVGLTQTAPIPNTFDAAANQAAQAGAGNGNANAGGGKVAGTNNVTAGGGSAKGAAAKGAAAKGSNASDGNASGGAGSSDTNTNKSADAPAASALSSQVLGPASIAVVPPASIPDGLTPETFYTYQIVYLPDLTQKYGLRVKGGVGEMRATLNMVNGWMFTGPGPVYFHDSSTAETVSAYGSAVSGVLESAASFVSSIYGIPAIGGSPTVNGNKVLQGQSKGIENFAQLWVYEPVLVPDATVVGGKRMDWRLLPNVSAPTISLNRDIVAASTNPGDGQPAAVAGGDDPHPEITEQANQAINQMQQAGKLNTPDLSGLKVSRTDPGTGGNFTITVNKTLNDAEQSTLLDGLKALHITQVSVAK